MVIIIFHIRLPNVRVRHKHVVQSNSCCHEITINLC